MTENFKTRERRRRYHIMTEQRTENLKTRLNEEHARLLPLYDEMTEGMDNWKEPFTAAVPTDEFDDYSAAAVFFVGAPLVKTNTDYDITGVVDVSCVGYYAAVGA